MEQQNQTTMRIFKTQAEINFFQTQQAHGGGLLSDFDGSESFRRNRILVEPVKEPVFIA